MPKAFAVNDVLPATTQLKIAWTETDSDGFAYESAINLITMDSSFHLVRAGNVGMKTITYINDVGVVEFDFGNTTWLSNCGDAGTSSCGTDKWVIIDTSDWNESKRTIASVHSWLDGLGLTYEDLDPQEEPTGKSNITVNNQPLKNAFVGSSSVAKIFVNDALVYDKAGEEPAGFSVTLSGNVPNFSVSDGSAILSYSLDNGSTWTDYTSGSLNVTLENVEKIKFKISADNPSFMEFNWDFAGLNISISCFASDTKTSANITITENTTYTSSYELSGAQCPT